MQPPRMYSIGEARRQPVTVRRGPGFESRAVPPVFDPGRFVSARARERIVRSALVCRPKELRGPFQCMRFPPDEAVECNRERRRIVSIAGSAEVSTEHTAEDGPRSPRHATRDAARGGISDLLILLILLLPPVSFESIRSSVV